MAALVEMLPNEEEVHAARMDGNTRAEPGSGKLDLMTLPTWADFMHFNGICLYLPHAKYKLGSSRTGLKRKFEIAGAGAVRRNEIKTYASHQLKADLRGRGLSRAGFKEDLINRLIQADCEPCEEGIALLNIPEADEAQIPTCEWLAPTASRHLTMAEYRSMAMIESHERPGFIDRNGGSRPILRLLHPLPTGRLKDHVKRSHLQKSLVPKGTMIWASIWRKRLAGILNPRQVEYPYSWCDGCGLQQGPLVRIILCLACEKKSYCSEICQKAARKDHECGCKASQKLRNYWLCQMMYMESQMIYSDTEACELAKRSWCDLAAEEGLQIAEEQRVDYAKHDKRFGKTQHLNIRLAGVEREMIVTLKAFGFPESLAEPLRESENWTLQQSLKFVALAHSLVEHKLRLSEYDITLGGARNDQSRRLVASAMKVIEKEDGSVTESELSQLVGGTTAAKNMRSLTVRPLMKATVDTQKESAATVDSDVIVPDEELSHLLADMTKANETCHPATRSANDYLEGRHMRENIASENEVDDNNRSETSLGRKDTWDERSSRASDVSIESGSAVECPQIRPHSPRRRLASQHEDADDWRLGGTALVEHGFMPSKPVDLPKPKYTWISESDLRRFNGTNGEEKLYIAVKGIVFNISTSNSGWFKPGEPWHAMTGKDASCALAVMSVEPKSNLVPYYKHLENKDQQTLSGWFDFFGYRYPVVGRVLWNDEGLVHLTHGYDGQVLPLYKVDHYPAVTRQATPAQRQRRDRPGEALQGSESGWLSTNSSISDSGSVSVNECNDLSMSYNDSIIESRAANGCLNVPVDWDENLTPVRRDEEWNSDWTDSVEATDGGGPEGPNCGCEFCVTNWNVKWGRQDDLDMSKYHALEKKRQKKADRNVGRDPYRQFHKAEDDVVKGTLSRAEERAAATCAWLEQQGMYGPGVDDLEN